MPMANIRRRSMMLMEGTPNLRSGFLERSMLNWEHPVTRCQYVLWVELRLRCLDDLPGRSIVPFPVVLRHRNRARRHAVTTYVARPFIERAIERDHGRGVAPRRQDA